MVDTSNRKLDKLFKARHERDEAVLSDAGKKALNERRALERFNVQLDDWITPALDRFGRSIGEHGWTMEVGRIRNEADDNGNAPYKAIVIHLDTEGGQIEDDHDGPSLAVLCEPQTAQANFFYGMVRGDLNGAGSVEIAHLMPDVVEEKLLELVERLLQ